MPRASLPTDLKVGRFVRRWLPLVALVVLIGGGIAMGFAMQPHKLPVKADPGWLDNIFASRTVVWAMRMLIFVGAVYVVGSVIALVAQGMWLTDFGPFKVSESFGRLKKRVEDSIQELDRERESREDLARRLEERDNQLANVTQERDELRQQLDTERGKA